jgi:hypothetical protein
MTAERERREQGIDSAATGFFIGGERFCLPREDEIRLKYDSGLWTMVQLCRSYRIVRGAACRRVDRNPWGERDAIEDRSCGAGRHSGQIPAAMQLRQLTARAAGSRYWAPYGEARA